jgi:hypothetical protein
MFSPILQALLAGIGTVLVKLNGCRGIIGPVPQPSLDEYIMKFYI